MISDSDKPEQKPPAGESGEANPQDKPRCEMCKKWESVLVNPQKKMAIGACCNDTNGEAPFGIMTAHFACCDGFEKKEAPSLISVPKGVVNRLKNIRR